MSRAAFRGFQVFCAFVVLICLALGAWQVQRYFWKSELRAQADELAQQAPIDLPNETTQLLAHTPLELEGQFLLGSSVIVRGYALNNVSGARLYEPFQLTDGRVVVVLRGWASHANALKLEILDAPQETIIGHWRPVRDRQSDRSLFKPVNDPSRNVWTHIDTQELADFWGLDTLVQGGYVELRAPNEAAQGAQIAPFALDLFDRHLEYIITWWALALTISAIYLFVWRDQRRRRG